MFKWYNIYSYMYIHILKLMKDVANLRRWEWVHGRVGLLPPDQAGCGPGCRWNNYSCTVVQLYICTGFSIIFDKQNKWYLPLWMTFFLVPFGINFFVEFTFNIKMVEDYRFVLIFDAEWSIFQYLLLPTSLP